MPRGGTGRVGEACRIAPGLGAPALPPGGPTVSARLECPSPGLCFRICDRMVGAGNQQPSPRKLLFDISYAHSQTANAYSA